MTSSVEEPTRDYLGWADKEVWVHHTYLYDYEVIVVSEKSAAREGLVLLRITASQGQVFGGPEETRSWATLAIGAAGGIVTEDLVGEAFRSGIYTGLRESIFGELFSIAWVVASATHRPLAMRVSEV